MYLSRVEFCVSFQAPNFGQQFQHESGHPSSWSRETERDYEGAGRVMNVVGRDCMSGIDRFIFICILRTRKQTAK